MNCTSFVGHVAFAALASLPVHPRARPLHPRVSTLPPAPLVPPRPRLRSDRCSPHPTPFALGVSLNSPDWRLLRRDSFVRR
eukprot:6210479-Prymnesium_polylepis.1